MSKLEHTKGPWSFEGKQFEEAYLVSCVYGGTKFYVCSVWDQLRQQYSYDVMSDEEMRANARLIAAAPEMLDALIQLYGVFDEEGFRVNKELKPIIEKATGLPIEEVLK